MRPERKGRVVRLVGEFLVIFVGVLTALAVDQFMEGRNDRVREGQLLRSLVEDLQIDSADFAALPETALGRAWAAEVVLREFAPDSPRGIRVAGELDDLGEYPPDATGRQLVRAFAALGNPSDLDVASGAYGEFSSGGGQRLVQNQELRRAIHAYYASVQSNLKFDPRVGEGMRELERRSVDLGLHHGDGQQSRLRERLSAAGPSYFAALRRVQQDGVVQSDIAELLMTQAVALMATLRAELGEGDRAAP